VRRRSGRSGGREREGEGEGGGRGADGPGPGSPRPLAQRAGDRPPREVDGGGPGEPQVGRAEHRRHARRHAEGVRLRGLPDRQGEGPGGADLGATDREGNLRGQEPPPRGLKEADMRAKSVFSLGLAAAGSLLAASVLAPAFGESTPTSFGVRTGVYTDASEAFLGAEALTPIAQAWYFNPNLEYAFAGSRDVLALSGDFHYDFLHNRPYYVWAGAGPSVVRKDDGVGDHRTDLGVNLIGG